MLVNAACFRHVFHWSHVLSAYHKLCMLDVTQMKRNLGLPLLNVDEALLAARQITILPEEMGPSEIVSTTQVYFKAEHLYANVQVMESIA